MANGIPPLLNQATSAANVVILLAADALLIARLINPASKIQWGIFSGLLPVIVPDSIVSFDFKNEWHLPTAPQENGAFQSYNKVATPFEPRVTMTKGGSESDKHEFLNKLESVAAALTLYTVVTPTRTYENVNITHYDYHRTATNGVGLLTVDVYMQEVRVAPPPAFTNTAQPSGANSVNGGSVQPGQSASAPAFQ
jgi:hypothetical protein